MRVFLPVLIWVLCSPARCPIGLDLSFGGHATGSSTVISGCLFPARSPCINVFYFLHVVAQSAREEGAVPINLVEDRIAAAFDYRDHLIDALNMIAVFHECLTVHAVDGRSLLIRIFQLAPSPSDDRRSTCVQVSGGNIAVVAHLRLDKGLKNVRHFVQDQTRLSIS